VPGKRTLFLHISGMVGPIVVTELNVAQRTGVKLSAEAEGTERMDAHTLTKSSPPLFLLSKTLAIS